MAQPVSPSRRNGRRSFPPCTNGIAIVSAPDGHRIAGVPIGKGADGAAFDEQRGIALIPAGQDGTLTVIALGKAPHVIQTVVKARSARTIALDPVSGKAYLPTADMQTVAGERRPQAIKGTWRVIVVAP